MVCAAKLCFFCEFFHLGGAAQSPNNGGMGIKTKMTNAYKSFYKQRITSQLYSKNHFFYPKKSYFPPYFNKMLYLCMKLRRWHAGHDDMLPAPSFAYNTKKNIL